MNNKTIKIIATCLILAALLLGSVSMVFALERGPRTRGREAGMMLDLTGFSMGTMNKVEDKKQYLSTIQLEKQRIQNYTLRIVYENAYRFYKRGDYERAQELAQSIVSIDPSFTNARTLAEQARRMSTYGTASEPEIIAAKMAEGERLYQAGRLIEANRKFEEVLVIQPSNGSAKNWIAKVDKEIAQEHERRGDAAYQKRDYSTALDQWYSALLIRKDDAALTSKITKAEREQRDIQLKAAMEEGVNNYSSGKLIASYNSFQKALKIQPGEPKAEKFSTQLRVEIADGYVASGNKNYYAGKYNSAIANWQEAKKWGYESAPLDAAIKKAKTARDNPQPKKTTPVKQPVVNVDPVFDPNAFDTPEFNNTLPGSLGAQTVSEENKRYSEESYRRGQRAFNNDDYETARREWLIALEQNPGNADAEAGLKKVQEILEVR